MNFLIEEQSQLKDLEPLLTQIQAESGVVSVDTEFLREKTYSAKLCLIQLGIGEHQYCIDVLAIDDLGAIKALFSDTKVLKLFHAARQDMEVIYQTLGVLPRPIFDTQLAAAFCGADMQIGYGALVEEVTGVELPKTQSRTDWTRRPLSAEQIKYAGEDVEHLEAIYLDVKARLDDADKHHWYLEEIETYYDLDKYVIDPEVAYQRLSGGGLNIKQQYILKALASWREVSAQARDIPRTWVMRDEKLFDLATQQPSNEEQIKSMGVFGRKSGSYLAPQALEVIQSVVVGEERIWRKAEPLTKPEKSLCSGMMRHLAKRAKHLEIAQALLGTRKDMEHLFRYRQSKKLMNGWRKSAVGEPLLAYLKEHKA
ncbi:ribonuclease D [Arenicella xantha]|uniref:Ribonuclease D n=1 Tax=Arenicella xantha TaxID=644221 RepID=A0A395JLX1_9GAMM|nr:ribonuclease D [Arenicella xantha]RBP50847.1 ribonuclease D [Arenicella xantha]